MKLHQKLLSLLVIFSILLSNSLAVYAQTADPNAALQPTNLPAMHNESTLGVAPTQATQETAKTTTGNRINEVNAAPGPFNKTYPGSSAIDIPTSIKLTWDPAPGAAYYLICITTEMNKLCHGLGDNTNFTRVNDTSYLADLNPNTAYSWQVRALSATGEATPGNGDGQWWTFTTGNYPAPFKKTYPGSQATNIPTRVVLTWEQTAGAAYYLYCVDTTNDLHCDWGDNNFKRVDGTSAIETLLPGQTYSWQVRAFSSDNVRWTPGNGSGQWWTFTTNPTDPAPFPKSSPANNATNVALSATLSWQPAPNAVRYGYCLDTNINNSCETGDNFTPVNGTSVVTPPLQPNTKYEWQVRAYAANGDWMPADGSGVWWTFTTGTGAPGAFGKLNPPNGAQNITAQPTLSWQAAPGAVGYGYCFDLVLDNSCANGPDNFTRISGTSITLPTLAIGKTYEWQARAYAANGAWTPADGSGQWWRFVTNAGGPAAFGKQAPSNNATNVATMVMLSWQPTAGAVGYSYCLDANINNSCEAGVDNFIRVSGTSVALSLEPGKTYEWQARAYTANGAWTPADGSGAWWRFTTTANGTSPFAKITPTNGATDVPTSVRLSWSPSTNAVKYGYCLDNTLDNKCDVGVDSFTFVNDTSVVLSLAPNKSYQWQARAYAADGSWTPANGSGQWWSFSTIGSLISGYTPGEFSVNEAGAANYKIPFVMPAGSAGLTPQIELTFDSRGSNTMVGWGWSLTGLSLISRCPTTLAQHGFIDPVDFDGNDQFCMDGQLLVAVSGAYGADQTVYRTENESFTKIVSVGAAGNGPLGFKAWTKAGLIIEYGFTTDSRLEAAGRADILYWGVSKISDTKSNYMLFTYDKFTTTGELLPRQITYTGNTALNAAPYARVEFTYELRPDGRVQFIAGTAVRLAKRLQYLRTYVDNALVRDFRFGYEASPTTGRSRLVNLTECSGDGQCLPATRLDWSSKTPDELNFNGTGSGAWVGHTGGISNNVVGDFNADGRTDLAGYTGTNGQWHVCYSTGTGFTCSYQTAHAGGVSRNTTGDFNGDGRSDLAGYTGSNGSWHVCLSTGSGFSCTFWQGHAGDITRGNNFTADFNGDGRSDIAAYAGNGQWHVCLSTGSNFQCSFWAGHRGTEANNVVADFNGDGMADMAGYTGSNNVWDVCLSTGSGFQCGPWTGHGGGVSNNAVGDFNGDGLADMAGYMGNFQWHVCLSTGVGFECSVWVAHGGGASNNVIGDFNGDGLTDMAGHLTGTFNWHVCLSTGAGFTCGNRTWTGHGGDPNNNASGDYNGDGKTDLAGYNAATKQWHVTLANDIFADQLTQITNGQGARVLVDYAPLTNAAIYQKANDAIYPRRDFQAPMYVVAGYGVSNGNGGLHRTNYTYAGLKTNVIGRGFLGFASITAVDGETNLKTVTQYLQTHPYKSLVSKIEQFQPNGKLIHSVANTWSVLNLGALVQAAALDEQAARRLYPTSPTETPTEQAVWPDQATAEKQQTATEAQPDPGLLPHVYLPLISAGEQPTAEQPTALTTAYDFTHFIDYGEPTSPDQAATSAPDVTLADDAQFTVNMAAAEISAANLEAITAPNAQGVTYFPYVSQSTTLQYELDGSLVFSTTTSTQYDNYGNPTQIAEKTSDGYIKTTANTYTNDNARWLLGRLTLAKVTAQAPGQAVQTRTSAFAYDAVTGLLLREETEPGTPLSLVKTYEYGGFGNMTKSTVSGPDINPRSQSTMFDSRGRNLIIAINALGQQETRAYDERLGLPTSLTDANGLVTTRKYDGFGRLLEETRPDGTKTTLTYRSCDLVPPCTGLAVYYVRTEVTGAPPSTIYFDRIDREKRRETVGFAGQLIDVDKTYNARGELATVSEPYFAGATPLLTSYTYELLSRALSETRPNRAVTQTAYKGTTVQTTNPLGQTSTRTVNSQGWLLRSADAAGNAITYSYDSFGNLLTLVDPAGNTTTMQYDLRGRKTAMRDPDSGWVYYRYNTLGELTWQKDAKNQEVTQTYDLLGRMVSRVEPEGTSNWTYDTQPKGIGRLAKVQGVNGYQTTYTYDNISRLTQTAYTLDGQILTLANTYDSASRVDTVTYPGGFAIRNTYNQYGYLSEVRRVADNALYWQANTLNARGQLEKATLGNGLITNQQFNAQTGLLSSIQTGPAANAAQVQNLAYAFDAIGNLTSRADKNQNLTEAFAYDTLNRLTSALVTGRAAQTVQYNALGNITFKSDVGSYTYGQNGAGPHAVTAIAGGISANFTYDANGNRISSTGGSISYTSFNLPTTLVQGSNRISYVYGPDHDRYKRTVQANGVLTTTLLLSALYEKTTVGALTIQNYYIPAGGHMVAQQVARSNGVNSTLYLHRDHLGSIDAITDATGKVVERDSYDAWGKRRTSDWRSINAAITSMVRRGYTGHEQLDEVGLIHMNGRVYDPTLGRFLSPDPVIQAPEFSQSLNRYSYVLNNPLSLTDPSGFNAFSSAWHSVTHFVKDNWKSLVAAAVTIGTAGWASGVWGWSIVSSSMLGGFVGGVTQARLYGGDWIKAIRSGLIDGTMAFFNPISASGTLKSITGGLSKMTTNISGSLWGGVKYVAGSYTASLVTNHVIRPLAEKLGLSLKEFNLGLTAVSWLGAGLVGNRIRDYFYNPATGKYDRIGIAGVANRGVAGYLFDIADVMLGYQGLQTSTSWQYANQFGIATDVLGHSLGSLDAINLARSGLAISAQAYALPIFNVAPGNASVTIGDEDPVNGFMGGFLFNPDAKLHDVAWFHHSQECYGISLQGCGPFYSGWTNPRK